MSIRPIFSPSEDVYTLLSNSEYNWTITKCVMGAAVEFEANNAPADIQDNLKVLHVDVVVPDQEAALNFVSSTVANANSIQLEFNRWEPGAGWMIGDIIVDGNRMSTLLIENNLATT